MVDDLCHDNRDLRVKTVRFAIFVLLSVWCLSPTATAQSSPAAIHIEEADDGFLFSENGNKVLLYRHRPTSLSGQFERANYIHPMFDLDGNEITEDFPDDHPHQRGVFWAWHQVRVGDQAAGDAWLARDFQWNVRQARIQSAANSSSLQVRVTWQSPAIKNGEDQLLPLVEERTTITAHAAANDARIIDLFIRLRALQPNVSIGGSDDDKGYGGFSARLRLPDDVQFMSAQGVIQPQRTPIRAGAWVDVQGSFGESGNVNGIALLGHPANPDFPQPWILRSRDSMQNAVFPGRTCVDLPGDRPLALAYRMVLHRRVVDPSQLATWLEQFAQQSLK